MTGYTSGALDGNTSTGSSDIFVVKFNSSGTKQWSSQQGTSSSDSARGIAIDSSRNVYVAGYTLGALDSNNNAGDRDIFVIKFNSDGIKQ